MDTLKRNECSI